MSRLILLVIVLLLLSFSINANANIGKVTEQKGSGEIVRSKNKVDAKINSGVESFDTINTANGVVGITFQDDTKVRVTEHSKLVIDDFVYDPKSKGTGKLAMKVALGTVRYASGAVARENSKNVDIKTPTATVAVRGTAFTMTVDEIGQSMVILLPNVDGSVGAIDVITSAGITTLNQAFQATFVTGSEQKPAAAVILNLSESMIDNMLIVKPPKEIIRRLQEEALTKNDALAYTELDKNLLDVPVWKDDLPFNDLNISTLSNNYLENALDTMFMNAFRVGYDSVTQLYVIDKGESWQLDRHVKDSFTMLINKDRGYEIILLQNGTLLTIKNMDSTSNKTTIKQGSK
jgi:hypothetical protein